MGVVHIPGDVDVFFVGETGDATDGYHSFNELYAHRVFLFILLAKAHKDLSWKSQKNADSTSTYDGWYLAGMHLPTGDISYHLPSETWDRLDVEELETAPEFDGYTSIDVLNRLKEWSHG